MFSFEITMLIFAWSLGLGLISKQSLSVHCISVILGPDGRAHGPSSFIDFPDEKHTKKID